MPVAYNPQTGEGVALGADNTWQKAPIAKHEDGSVVIYDGKTWTAAKSTSPASGKEKTSTIKDIAKSAGSGVAEGALDILPGALDLGARGGVYLGNKAGHAIKGNEYEDAPYLPSLTAALNRAAGIDYDPRTTAGQYAKTASGFIPAAVAGNPSALSSASRFGKMALGAAGSGVASEAAGQVTKGTSLEPYARALGGILPSAALVPGAQFLARKSLRGGSTPEDIEQNISTFRQAGTTPSVGQATGGYIPQAIESLLAKVPGSANTMKKFARNQAQDIGAGVDRAAAGIAPASSTEAAGRAIQNDVEKVFKPEVRKTQNQLYDAVDSYIPGETPTEMTHTKAMLDELTAPTPNAKNLSQNPNLNKTQAALRSIKEDFEKDMSGEAGTPAKESAILDQNGKPVIKPGSPTTAARTTMPYQAAKEARTLLNRKIQKFELEPDISKADLKRLAGALTKDMRTAIEQKGPEAVKAFDKANAYTSQLHEDLGRLEDVVNKNGGEKVFEAALSGSDKGASTVRTVMKALPEKSRGLFSAAVIRRMGKANPSAQNDIGNIFSTESFLTSWNKLSPAARSALFDGYGAGFSRNMDVIAKTASKIREGSDVFKNPSGTAPASGLIEAGKAAGSLALDIFPKLLFQAKTSEIFTNPKVVEWLAKTTKMPKSAAPAAIASLNNIIKGKDGDQAKKDQKKSVDALKMTISPRTGYYDQPSQQIPQTLNIQ